jgi:hypothetical protein
MARHRNKKTHCLNCDYEFKESENYCPNCSQENHDLKIPFKHFIEEILEGIFHFDSKVWLSIKTLFFYPGKITKDFLAGKRVSFVPPIRLYVFFSFIFFFLLNIVTTVDKDKKDDKLVDVLKEKLSKIDTTDGVKITGMDSLQIILESDSIVGKKQEDIKKLRKFMNMDRGQLSELNHQIYKYMSFALFFLLPIFALLMKLIYFRSHKYYYEHLIAAIHYHVIIFIILILCIPVYYFKLPWFLFPILLFSAFVYFVYSLKIVYNQSLRKSIVKAFLIFMIYSFILLLAGIACTVMVSYQLFTQYLSFSFI